MMRVYRLMIGAVCGLSLGLWLNQPSESAPASPLKGAIVTLGRGVGPVKLGMTPGQVVHALGPSSRESGGISYSVYEWQQDGLVANFIHGMLVGILLHGVPPVALGIKLKDGVGVGSSEDAVAKDFGVGSCKPVSNPQDPLVHAKYAECDVAGPAKNQTRFTIDPDDGTVSEIQLLGRAA
jgi:hypothetical protein